MPPLTEIWENFAGWSERARTGGRCGIEGKMITKLPIPVNFVFNKAGSMPNAGVAILKADGRTIYQAQPFSRCTVGSPATSQYFKGETDIYGTGISGAHGGSSLSAIGGTVRMGELLPGSILRHALKVNLDASTSLSYNERTTKGFRWPASAADSYASSGYRGTNPVLVMGALLALKPDFDELILKTEPGRIVAGALKDYGAYVVDDSAYDGIDFVIENGPSGNVYSEVKKQYGFDMWQWDNTTPWLADIRTISQALYVIDNNTSSSIGGGGVPRQPLAPPFKLSIP